MTPEQMNEYKGASMPHIIGWLMGSMDSYASSLEHAIDKQVPNVSVRECSRIVDAMRKTLEEAEYMWQHRAGSWKPEESTTKTETHE